MLKCFDQGISNARLRGWCMKALASEVERHFAAAVERTADQRRAYLDEHCPAAETRRAVEALLAHDVATSAFLREPVRALAAGARQAAAPHQSNQRKLVGWMNSHMPLFGTGKPKTTGRYELIEKIGEGGMGTVWRANDRKLNNQVAVKILWDTANPTKTRLFQAECRKLGELLTHPNIISIRDADEIEMDGVKRPFLVMPLLEGQTLAELIQTGRDQITAERLVEIVYQTCKALDAAHEKGIVHRDIKPSNIFVLRDYTVMLIDFGVARWPDSQTMTEGRMRGTLLYMAPEQILCKPVTKAADIFALGATCYEALTGTSPFLRETEEDLAAAICHANPAPLTAARPDIAFAVAQVIHVALAKSAAKRHLSAREFGEAMRKALYAPGEIYPLAKPRLDSARQAYEQGEFEFAQTALNEMLAEGCIHGEVVDLARKTEIAAKEKRIQQSLQSARARFDAGEVTQAFRRVNEVLEMDQDHPAAQALHAMVRARMDEGDVREKLQLAGEHLANARFDLSRQEAKRILAAHPGELRAEKMLAEIDRAEKDYRESRQQQEQAYHAALTAYERRDISAAMSRVEHLRAQGGPYTDPARQALYEGLYQQIRGDHEAIREGLDSASQLLDRGEPAPALEICDRLLTRYPAHTNLLAVKWRAQELQHQALSGRIAEVDRVLRREPDLAKQVRMLEEAVRDHPDEAHFQRQLAIARDRLRHVEELVARARGHEERREYAEALQQWEALQLAHAAHPGLAVELDRVRRLREEAQRRDARQKLIAAVDEWMEAGEFERALTALEQAPERSPELDELEKQARQALARREQAAALVVNGRADLEAGRAAEGLALLREAAALDPLGVREPLANALALRGRDLLESDTAQAETALREAVALVPRHTLAQSLLHVLEQRREHDRADRAGAEARQLQTEGRYREALARVEEGLRQSPGDAGLRQLKETLARRVGEEMRRDSDAFHTMLDRAAKLQAPGEMREQRRRLEAIIEQHPEGAALRESARAFFTRVDALSAAPPPAGPSWLARLQANPVALAGAACVMLSLVMGGALALRSSLTPAASTVARPARTRMGWLMVQTEPARAVVRLAGRAEPLVGSVELEPRAYEMEVTAAGYVTAKKTVHVILGQAAEEKVTLAPLPYTVRIRGLREAIILHGGQQVRVRPGTDYVSAELAPGRYEWQVFIAPGMEMRVKTDVDAHGVSAGFVVENRGLSGVAVSRLGAGQTVCRFEKAPAVCSAAAANAPVEFQKNPVALASEHGALVVFGL